MAYHTLCGDVSPELEGVPGRPCIAIVVKQSSPVTAGDIHVLSPGDLSDIGLVQEVQEVVEHQH